MATRTLYFKDAAVASGPGTYVQMDEGAAPAAGSQASGCNPGTAGVPRFWKFLPLQITPSAQVATTTRLTAAPNGQDGYRSVQTYNGTFAAGNWTYSAAVIASGTDGGGQLGGLNRFRLWRVTAGGVYTELTAGAVDSSSFTALTLTTPQTVSAVVALGTVTLTDEYLVVQMEWETTTAGTFGTRSLVMYGGSATSLATTDFTGTASGVPATVLPRRRRIAAIQRGGGR